MATQPDECSLEETARDQAFGAALFLPFVVARLRGSEDPEIAEALLSVRLQNIPEGSNNLTQRRMLRLRWNPGSVPTHPFGVQERTITEWAACGVACAVVARYGAGLRIRTVASEGDRFDYWVDNGNEDRGLEVSGTMTADVEARHQAKVRQLLANPYGVDGYVVVVGFATREVIFSFHRFLGEQP